MANPSKTWALLIGIDFYPNVTERLSGCVNDVEDVELFLRVRLGNLSITKLTASVPTGEAFDLPIEEESKLPTLANVKSAFAWIINSASKGDSVYVHYSGHGTQINTNSTYLNRSSTKDAALCLYRVGKEDSYLRGFDLANMLDKMAGKGLIVTVVLDACSSGSVTRNDGKEGTKVRGIEWNPSISSPGIAGSVNRGTRDGNSTRHWLLDPQDYALLAACGPHEKAKEEMLDGKRRGVFTYNMITLLALPRNHKSKLTFPDLFSQLVARMHVGMPTQNPMSFGQTDTVFCGSENLQAGIEPAVISTVNKLSIRHNVGRAHGATEDDEYAVYPQCPTESREVFSLPPIRFKITSVNDIDSIASPNLSTELDELATGKGRIEAGCRAKPLTHFSLHKTHVKVPRNFLSQKGATRDATSLSLLEVESTEDTVSYTVRENSNEEYQVHDAMGEALIHTPTVPIRAHNSQQKILNIVEHIAKFKFIESLENRNPEYSFENSFEMWIRQNGTKAPDKALGFAPVKDGGIVEIVVKNHGKHRLYCSILNLRPLWGIEPLFKEAGRYKCIEPGTKVEVIKLRMQIPGLLKSKGHNSILDILKIFVTREVARFDVLAMRSLGSEGYRGDTTGLSELLKELPPSQKHTEVVINKDLWVARNFMIRTSLE